MGFFATECDDLVAVAGRQIRRLECDVFVRFADQAEILRDEDLQLERRRIAGLLGRSTDWVEQGILGYFCLRDFPRLLALQKETARLDVARLAAVQRATACLMEIDAAEVYEVVDDLLVEMFAPKSVNQSLPAPRTIRERINNCIRQFDAELAPNQKRKKEREEEAAKPGGETPLRLDYDALTKSDSLLTLSGSDLHLALIMKNIESVAKEHDLSQVEAAVGLLLGELESTSKVVVNVYTPKTNPGSYYVEGLGWTNAESTAIIEEFLANHENVVVNDLDIAAGAETEAYEPTEAIKRYVRARDGGCIFPGCGKPAEKCQLDHRIPFGDGGKTTPSNLFCLCQKHHNLKTDRRGFYLPDPETGDIVWLFSDGTYAVVAQDGILADYTSPTMPRWKQTLAQRDRAVARREAFISRCHSALDQYERDGEYNVCTERLRKLEEKYGLTFEHWPDPPAPSEPKPEPRRLNGWATLRLTADDLRCHNLGDLIRGGEPPF